MRTALAFSLCLWVGLAAAQSQRPDVLMVEGRAEPLAASPLQPALESDAKLAERLKRQVSKKPCAELARSYLATWEIRDNTLYLVKLDGDACGGGKNVPLSLLFPGSSAPVKASWFSGELRSGRTIHYVKGGALTGTATLERGSKK